MEEFETNVGDKLWVHNAGDCRGPVCPIHNPTPHHMREWPMIWRGDRRIFERLCPKHGTGHPDPDDMEAQTYIKGYADGVHGCCMCCVYLREGDYVAAQGFYSEQQYKGILSRSILEAHPPQFVYFIDDEDGNTRRIRFDTAYRLDKQEFSMVDFDPELRSC